MSRWKNWEVSPCENELCNWLVYEAENDWTEYNHHIYHIECYFSAKKHGRIKESEEIVHVPQEKPKEKRKV